MRGLNMLQIVGGVAVAGAVAAGSTALTGHGLTRTTGANATDDKFVGGTITQNITGGTANVDSIAYGYTDATNTKINQIVIKVTAADARTLAVTPNGGTLGGGSPVADEWVCTGVTAASTYGTGTATVVLNDTTSQAQQTVTCTPAANNSNAHSTTGRYYAGLSSLDVTVS